MSQLSAPSSKPAAERFWLLSGAIHCGLAVALGAFAAHGLGPRLVELYGDVSKEVAGQRIAGPLKYLADFKTAAEYQMTHGLALLAVGGLLRQRLEGWLVVAARCFQFGIILFSGSLYLLVLTGATKLGAVTPLGGILMLTGWLCLAVGVYRSSLS